MRHRLVLAGVLLVVAAAVVGCGDDEPAAPEVETPVRGGPLQIYGDFTEEQATALADRLEG